MAKMMSPDFTDPRMDQKTNPTPFDGKRMIFGGFPTVVDRAAEDTEGFCQRLGRMRGSASNAA